MPISVANYDVAGWPRETHTINQFQADRVVRTAWADRFTYRDEIGSYPNNLYPYRPQSQATVVSLETVPWPGGAQRVDDDGLADYEFARHKLVYSTRGPLTADLIVEKLQKWYQRSKSVSDDLKWADGGAVDWLDAPMRGDYGLTYVIKRFQMLAIPSYVYFYPGYVNSNVVTAPLLGMTLAAKTVLYAGADVYRGISTSGTTHYQVEDTFHFFYGGGGGWNYTWRTSTGQYEQVNLNNGARYRWFPAVAF